MTQVFDASAVTAGLIDDSPVGRWCEDRLADGELAAPHLMPFEVANIVRRTVARGAIDASAGASAIDFLDRLAVQLVPFELVSGRVWELRSNLTAYDASYVAVAELFEAPLVTLDERLARSVGLRCEVVPAPRR